MDPSESHRQHWRGNLRVTAILLVIWFVASFGVGFFARSLDFNFFGWPFYFYMSAQGSLIVYVLIIWYYARYMERLDHRFGVDEGDEE